MKIKTLEQLEEKLDEDFAWRKKELSIILGNVKSTKDFMLKTALRTGIALLYAHWEGFIKNAAEYYLTYVSQKKLKYEELTHNFIALAFRQRLSLCQETTKPSIHIDAVRFIREHLNETSQIPCVGVIKTESNLKSKVLKDIITAINLDYSPYELKANLIDATLLNLRNTVAHGQDIEISQNDFIDLYNDIVAMLNIFRGQVSNAASQNSYKIS